MNMVIESIMEAIMKKVYDTLIALYSKLPTANVHKSSNLELSELDKIVSVIKAYGQPVIMGTGLAISQIKLDTNASEADKLDIRNKGYVGKYKGCPVVEILNSFEDEDNSVKTMSDKYLFILPSGQEKVIKVAMEGGLFLLDTVGKDRTVNFDGYQKVGVGTLAVNNVGMYQIESLT